MIGCLKITSKLNSLLNCLWKQFLNNGNKAYKRGDIDKAKTLYKKALKYDTEFYLAYFQLGVLEKKLGNSSLAIQYLNKMLIVCRCN